MKLPLMSFKQAGFTIIEIIVSIVIFTIIVIGSSALLTHSFNVQKEMSVNNSISNFMQQRLRVVEQAASGSEICEKIQTVASFPIDNQVYYIGCAIEKIEIDVNGEMVSTGWPVVAVSVDEDKAQECAEGTADHADCFVIGR